MFLVLYKLWCFTFPLNHFGNLIQKICFSWCFYIWVEILSIRNYLAIVFSLNALNKCCFSGSHCLKLRGHGQEVVVSPALWTQSWSWMVEVVVSPALWMQLWSWVVEVVVGLALWIQSWSWAGDSCQSCIVNTVVVMLVEEVVSCVASELLLLTLPTCSFESEYHAFAFCHAYMNRDLIWRRVLLRRRDLWAKAWQPIHSHSDLSLHCTFEYGCFVFSAFFRPILGKEWILWKWEGI